MEGLPAGSRGKMDEKTLTCLSDLILGVAGDRHLVATMLYGSRVAGYARKDSFYDCMAICEYPGGTRYHHARLGDSQVSILEIDNTLFLLDVQVGALGEFVAGRLLFPYLGLNGSDYLAQKEIAIKERVIKEETEELIRHYGEASRGLVINPEYFALSHLLRRSRTYPPLRYSYLNTFCTALRDRNLARIMPGYALAVKSLITQRLLYDAAGKLSISDEFIDRTLSRKNKEAVVNVVQVTKKALSSYLMQGRAGLVSPELISREVASRVRRELSSRGTKPRVEDPSKYLFLNTANGLVPMDERGTIRDIIFKIRPGSKITIAPLGGVLNEVYLVTASNDKLVAKKFTDWHNFKWFTLNLVTLGTKMFSVSGKARLSNEFGMSHLLRRRGIHVPEILGVSLPNRILVEKYIDGCSMVDIVREIVGSRTARESHFEDIAQIGKNIARIHSLGIQLGDSKPENFLKDTSGKIYTIDLEQARKGKDFAWDIAEFLYYSAHYATSKNEGIRRLAESFVSGYSENGDLTHLRRAAGISYLKVFSLWALPQVNYAVSETLRNST